MDQDGAELSMSFQECDVEMFIYGAGDNAKKMLGCFVMMIIILCLYVNYGVKRNDIMLKMCVTIVRDIINAYFLPPQGVVGEDREF